MKDLESWYENESECIPYCVMEEIPFGSKNFKFLSNYQYEQLRKLYSNSHPLICELIDKTAVIATQNLYGGVRDGSPITLKYIDEIILAMRKAKIDFPRIDFFEQFKYTKNPENDWQVWGNAIPKELLKGISNKI